jgi:hypothetical protein
MNTSIFRLESSDFEEMEEALVLGRPRESQALVSARIYIYATSGSGQCIEHGQTEDSDRTFGWRATGVGTNRWFASANSRDRSTTSLR